MISQNAVLFQISRYLLSSKSRFGINHTQWYRLFQGKASTIINGIDCYQERHRPLKVASLVYERENCVVANGANKQFNNQQARDLDSEFLEDHPKKRTMKEKGFELSEKYIKQSIAVSKVSKVEGSEIPWKQIKALKKSVINKLIKVRSRRAMWEERY